MSPRSALPLALTALLLASGCFTFKAALPGALRAPAPQEDVLIIGRFDHTITATYFFYGLVGGAPREAFADAMREAVDRAGGDGLANIIVDSHFDVGDVVIQQLTLGLVAPRSYRMRADIVRLSGRALPGKALVRGSTSAQRPRRSAPPAPPSDDEPPPPLDPAEPPPAPLPTLKTETDPADGPPDGPRWIP